MSRSHDMIDASQPSRLPSFLRGLDGEAWKRFFIAIAGLSLAMLAAVYSTVFRDAGNQSASVALASFSLIAAGVVGITTVPYLFRKVRLGRVRQRFYYEVTREGAVYLIVILVILVAGLNTGNNLLYIVASAMLAAILVSGIASAGMLRALDLDFSLPQHVFARRKILGRLLLRNRRRWAPAFSITVVPRVGREKKILKGWQRGIFAWPPRRPPERQWIRLRDWVWRALPQSPTPPAILPGSVYFPYIARKGTAFADVELNFERRGRYAQEGLGVATRFPFSFLTKTRPIAFSREIMVYPSVEETEDFFHVLPMITGEFESFVRGRGNNLYRIREHMPEDSARHVDWKATAKTGALKVREFSREDERKVRMVFDNCFPGVVSEAAYEKAISLAASLAWHFAQSDAQLAFRAPGYGGSGEIYDFLSYLAVVAPARHDFLLESLEVTDDYNIILTSRPRGSIPTSLWASSYFIFMEAGGEVGDARLAGNPAVLK